ncbi:MAG TPA: hypothetical protein VMM38_09465 [Aridibacter sp.]|nr:hypothetical protein [Aridibacter sp.]
MNANFRMIALLCVLLFLALACGRFGGTSTSSDENSSDNTLPEIPKEFVNMPSLFGKTKDEMKGLLKGGTLTNDHDTWFHYEFAWGTFSANFTAEEFYSMEFTLPLVQGGGEPYFLGEKKERLGEMVGIDLNGKVPVTIMDSVVVYEETIGGNEMDITLTPTEIGKDLFRSIRVSPKG